MKKKYRLRRSNEISALVGKRVFKTCSSFVVYYLKNEINHSRVCVSVSKKLGNAVIRNKIKRQIREMVNAIFDFNKNIDYVIVARKLYTDNTFEKNQELLKSVYEKIN